jgi:hypothetical protein
LAGRNRTKSTLGLERWSSAGGCELLVFIDESGDPGFDIEHGSTPLFVVTAVIFRAEAAASACRDRIRAVRAELGLPAGVKSLDDD